MTRSILKRVNFYDGQNVDEIDMDLEQAAWTGSLANNTDFLAGSGVEQDFAVQRLLLDTDSVPTSVQTLIDTQNFDGEPIYEKDAFNEVIYLQPSDSSEGNQLEVEISGASLDGTPVLRVYIFGTIFGGAFVHEVVAFDANESQITKNYFATISSIMTQEFRGNQNTIIDGVASHNLGGRLRIHEATPLSVTRDEIMSSQALEPSMDYVNFKPATLSKSLDDLLSEIGTAATQDENDLKINVTASNSRNLAPVVSIGTIIGQKFQATTDNIQKVSILLSVESDPLAAPGDEFNFTGDIVLGIRKLQVTTTCPTDIIPGAAIDFDPEPSTIAEISFSQSELLDIGVVLSGSPEVVDFIFTQSLLANPNVNPSIIAGNYYVITVRRSGDISTGTIVLEEAANTHTDVTVNDDSRMVVFDNSKWTDITESDMWFKVYTDAIRVTDGTAYDAGVQITSPKTKGNDVTGISEPYIEGNHSLIDVSRTADNYIIAQKANNFTDPESHPSTGNFIFSRIEDAPSISVVGETTLTTLIDAGSSAIVLGNVVDNNPVSNPVMTGESEFPGLLTASTFTIINPTSDITANNLVGSILTPNTNDASLKYRIINVDIITDAYGDIDLSGTVDINDVTRATSLDGYSKDFTAGSVSVIDQQNAIIAGTVTIDEIIRADVTNNGLINLLDAQLIQQNIVLGTAFTSGSSFVRAVITVENLADPTTTSPDMIGSDSSFNDAPYVNIDFSIDFIPLWKPSNIVIQDLRRFVPKTFTEIATTDITGDPKNGGKNISFVPGDLLLGGEVLNADGTTYSMDYETTTILIELPEGSTQGEIDIFNNFIKAKMTFFDGTLVSTSAISDNQIIVTSALQSLVKDIDGYDQAPIDGADAIDEAVALHYIESSGVLRIRAENIRNIASRPEFKTKIILTVHLKKAGFSNATQTIDSTKLNELLIPV